MKNCMYKNMASKPFCLCFTYKDPVGDSTKAKVGGFSAVVAVRGPEHKAAIQANFSNTFIFIFE